MRNMMVLSFVLYIATFALIGGWLGNAGLWLSLLVFLGARGISLLFAYRREFARSFHTLV